MGTNERLRRAMHRANLDIGGLAAGAEVSTKTVERWIAGTAPYPRTRYRVAAILHEEESYLWPESTNTASLAGAEVVATYPRRSEVPRHLWMELLRAAQRDVDLLAFAGLFLTEEHPEWLDTLAAKASAGVRVRLLLGDPDGTQLAARDGEHRIGGGVTGRVAAVRSSYEQRMPDSAERRPARHRPRWRGDRGQGDEARGLLAGSTGAEADQSQDECVGIRAGRRRPRASPSPR